MDTVNLALDANWAAGLFLAMGRVAGFVIVSPVLARSVPMVGRLAFVVAIGLFLADPVGSTLGIGGLIVAMVVNVTIGVILGFLTGIIFHLFGVAGSLIDLSSGLAMAQIYDPNSGEQAAVFSRMFNLVAVTIFVAIGGLQLLVRGLAVSVEAVALDGGMTMRSGLVELTLSLIGRMTIAAIELALPVVAALFLADIVLGLAGRLAPQANILLLGLPAKLLITVSLLGVSFLLFPEAIDGLFATVRNTFGEGMKAVASA